MECHRQHSHRDCEVPQLEDAQTLRTEDLGWNASRGSTVERLMAQRQIRRIPVVDEDHKPVGVISLNDLALECARPDTQMKLGTLGIASTLAAICQPRTPSQQAA